MGTGATIFNQISSLTELKGLEGMTVERVYMLDDNEISVMTFVDKDNHRLEILLDEDGTLHKQSEIEGEM